MTTPGEDGIRAARFQADGEAEQAAEIVVALAEHLSPGAVAILASLTQIATASRDKVAAIEVRDFGRAIIGHLGNDVYNGLMEEVGV